MVGLASLLGKRSPSTHPLGEPTVAGTIPGADDASGPPAAKVAVQLDLEALFEDLQQTVVELSARVAVRDDLHNRVVKLELQLGEGQQAKNALQRELASSEAAHKRSEEHRAKLERRLAVLEKAKSPVSYAAAVTRDEAESLRRDHSKIAGNVTQLQQVVEHQDRQSRISNVMVFGLEGDGEQTTVQQVTACLQQAGISQREKVVSAVRLASARSNSSSRPAPVKVVMQSASDAFELLRHTRALRQRFNVHLDRDITPQQAQNRREGQGSVKALRDLGYVTFWRGDQLWFVNRVTGKREIFNGRLPGRA